MGTNGSQREKGGGNSESGAKPMIDMDVKFEDANLEGAVEDDGQKPFLVHFNVHITKPGETSLLLKVTGHGDIFIEGVQFCHSAEEVDRAISAKDCALTPTDDMREGYTEYLMERDINSNLVQVARDFMDLIDIENELTQMEGTWHLELTTAQDANILHRYFKISSG
jgi:hypothetical protein